jgi:hypothetical protein
MGPSLPLNVSEAEDVLNRVSNQIGGQHMTEQDGLARREDDVLAGWSNEQARIIPV